MNLILIIVIIIIIALILFLISTYNGLVKSRNNVKNSWALFEVQLNWRGDLIPNLIETVKGYAAHESKVFDDVTQARAGLMNSNGVQEMANADNTLSQTLKSLFAVAENYPELKANENFQNLQNQLEDTENKISYSRQFYNDTVLMYNNKCETFPSNLFANAFGFKQAEFFKAQEGTETVPKVEF